MSDLVTSDNVAILRKAFEEHDGFELTLAEFMNTMNRVVLRQRAMDVGRKVTSTEELTFAVDMVELFKQIDVNGNGMLEWSEFTAYIVETGRMLESKETLELRKTTEAGFFVGERESRYVEHEEEVTNVERGHRDENEVICDGGLVPIGEPFNCLAVVCESSDVIRLFALPMRPKQIGFKQYKPQTLRHHTQFRPHRALGITCIPNLSVGVGGEVRSYIVSSSIDEIHGTGCFISFWARAKRSLKIVCRVNMHNVMDQLCWCSANDTLYSASSTHTATIEAWKLIFEPAVTANGSPIHVLECHKVATMQWHSSAVTRLRYIPDNVAPQIASFSKDGTVCFWNTHSNRRSGNQNVHDRGVRGCALSMKLGIIVTVGFGNICFPDTLCALVWQISGSNSIDVFAKLEGHEHPLVDAIIHEFPDDLAHIVTIDERGHLRRWCAHTFRCLQQFDVPEVIYGGVDGLLNGRPVELQAIAPLTLEWRVKTFEPPHPGIVVASGSSLGVMESLPVHHAAKPLICSVFNSVSMTFLTCAGRSIRIWDALTGNVLRTYGADILFSHGDRTTEITTCRLDDRKRKIITGDNHGHISVWNYLNGALMKVLDPHSKDISSLIYINGDKLTVSTSWDGKIYVNDELDNDGYNKSARKSVLMRDIHVQSTWGGQKNLFNERSATPSGKHLKVDIGGLQYSDCLGMLATCSHIGTTLILNLWDLEYMRLLGSIHCPSSVRIPELEVVEMVVDEKVVEEVKEVKEVKEGLLEDEKKADDFVQVAEEERNKQETERAKETGIGTGAQNHKENMIEQQQETEKFAQQSNKKSKNNSHNEIMSICFLDPFVGLAFSDDSGNVYLCTVPVHRRKFKCVGALVRPTLFKGDTRPEASVLSISTKEDAATGHLVIYAGCENGEVVEWILSPEYLENELGIPRASPNGHKQPAYNGRRTLRYGKYRAKELLPSRAQHGGLAVDKLNVLPSRWWQAHTLSKGIVGRDAVIDLHWIDAPDSLLCVSQNGTANLWDLAMNVDEERVLLEAKAEAAMTRKERIARNKRVAMLAEEKLNAGEDVEKEGKNGTMKNDDKMKSEGNRPPPRMLGILDPDINRATPKWKFTLDIDARERNNIIEAKHVMKEAEELRRKPRRTSLNMTSEEGNHQQQEQQQQNGSSPNSRRNSPIGSLMGSPIGSPRSSLGGGERPMLPPTTPVRVPNKHDYKGHNVVMNALATAFVRPISPERKTQSHGSSEKEDFRDTGVTADMLRGRISTDGGETMKWRREMEEQKKHKWKSTHSSSSSLPPVRGSSPRSNRRIQSRSTASARVTGLRSRVLSQLAPKKYGFVPPSNPATGRPDKWYEYIGSRSTVPRIRHLDPEKLDYLRNDGWEDIDDGISDNLSVIADDSNDLADFLTKKQDPADVWVDQELSEYASELHEKRTRERRDPNNKITGAPKNAGVTETIHYMREAARSQSHSRQGRMMKV